MPPPASEPAAVAPRTVGRAAPALVGPKFPTFPDESRNGNPTRASTAASTATWKTWHELNDIIETEASMRTAPAELNAANALGFVQARSKASQYAVAAIGKLDRTDVDADLARFIDELAAWYRRGSLVNEQATHLLEHGDYRARKGAPGKKWKSNEEQHRADLEQINAHGERLRQTLSERYGKPFPKLK